MKKIILTYGIISGSIIIGIIVISMLIWGMSSHTANSEWLGYLIMIAALSLIFFGIKSYRDNELGGVIRFWEALKVGTGILLVASVIYVGVWEIYIQSSGSDFMDQYAASYVEQMRTDGASEQEITDATAVMEEYKEMYQNPILRMGITFLEIFPVGLIIALISAVLLRKSSFLPVDTPAMDT